jgi:polysaccharide deacetylase 2 family uncharacterized protein YibQ
MGAGVFVGIFWGLVVSALVVTAVSLSAPLPPRSGAPALAPPVETASEDAVSPEGDATPDVAAGADEAGGDAPSPDADTATETATGTATDTDTPAAIPPALAALQEAQPGPSLDRDTGAVAEAVPLPAGSEFNRPPPEEAPVLPGTDETLTVRSPLTPEISVPAAPGGVETAPAPQPRIADAPEASAPAPFDTGALAVPEGDSAANTPPATLQPPPLAQLEPDSAAVADATSVAPPAAPAELAEDAVETAPEPPETETETATAAAPQTPQEATPPQSSEAVDVAQAQTPPAAEEPEVTPASPPVVVQLVPPQESAPLAMLPLDDLPMAEDTGDAMPDALPEPPRLLRPADADDPPAAPRTLPQIVSPARNVPDADDAATTSDVPVAELGEAVDLPRDETSAERGDVPALQAFAVPFDAAETRPLIAVILIDEPDDRLEIETLTRFSFPVAFAIDPARPDAAERAATYRAAGFEVLMLASVIPDGATAADTEVALSVARARVPEAIALMDTPDSRLQTDRVVLEAAVGAAAGEGQGFVAFPRGLNTAEQMAARADVPAATLFRFLDDEEQRATVITRFLGRAEFAAVQEGAVVVAGRTRPDTVTALFSWALGDRNEGVAIAPLSAVLQRLGE